jgi:hypothetical protein
MNALLLAQVFVATSWVTARRRDGTTGPTRSPSNETHGHMNHHVSALDPLHGISPDGRHRPRHGAGTDLNPLWVLILVVWLYGTLVHRRATLARGSDVTPVQY